MLDIISNAKYAALFPGQGSQFVGMISGFNNSPYLKELLPKVSDICNIDFYELLSCDKKNKLNLTQYTQPALLISSYVLWRHFSDYIKIHNISNPEVLAGHSLGEYSALVSAGCIDILDAIKLVYYRGLYMQDSLHTKISGAMAAILGLDNDIVFELVQDFTQDINNKNEILEVANYNALGQVVVSGIKNTVEDFLVYAKEKGAKITTLLPVSVPAHSSLMQNAADKLKDLLDKINFNLPNIPVFSNVTSKLHNENIDEIKQLLFLQMTSSVRWVEIIQNIKLMNIDNAYEIGVNNVLTKLNKRIDKSIKSQAINNIKEVA